MSVIRLDLPAAPFARAEMSLPPPIIGGNAKTRSTGRARARHVKTYRSEACQLFSACLAAWRRKTGQRWVPLRVVTVRPIFYWPDLRRRDRDNAMASLKPVWDGMEDARLIENDRGITALPPVFGLDKKRPRLHVEVYLEEFCYGDG